MLQPQKESQAILNKSLIYMYMYRNMCIYIPFLYTFSMCMEEKMDEEY